MLGEDQKDAGISGVSLDQEMEASVGVAQTIAKPLSH